MKKKCGNLRPIYTERTGRDGWTRWIKPRMKNYIMTCCDCGLAHRFQFAVMFRAQRAERYTAAQRKKRRRKSAR